MRNHPKIGLASCTCQLARRAVLGGMMAALSMPSGRAAGPLAGTAPNAISGDAALHRLIAGNERYAANKVDRRDFTAGRAERSKVQYPVAAILGCADSRVSPEFIFDQGPGELFVVRVAGNVLSDLGTASLEYAAQVLGVPLIVVLGHSGCGAVASAIKAADDSTALPGHLPELMARIAPAVAATSHAPASDHLAAAIAQNARLTEQQIATTGPLLSAMVAAGKVKLAAGVYDLASGKVRFLPAQA